MKSCGISPTGEPLYKFNVKLCVKYFHKRLKKVETVAVFPVVTTNKQSAVEIAEAKAREQLSVFPYIKRIEIEEKRR